MVTKRSPVPPSPKISRRIRALLSLHGMTQTELARRVGVTSATVSQWLSGGISITAANAKKVGEVFGEEAEFVMVLTDRGRGRLSELVGRFEDALDADQIIERLEAALASHSLHEILQAGLAHVDEQAKPERGE